MNTGSETLAYEDALVRVIQIFAARGRAIREARERMKKNTPTPKDLSESEGNLLTENEAGNCILDPNAVSNLSFENNLAEIQKNS